MLSVFDDILAKMWQWWYLQGDHRHGSGLTTESWLKVKWSSPEFLAQKWTAMVTLSNGVPTVPAGPNIARKRGHRKCTCPEILPFLSQPAFFASFALSFAVFWATKRTGYKIQKILSIASQANNKGNSRVRRIRPIWERYFQLALQYAPREHREQNARNELRFPYSCATQFSHKIHHN